MKIFITAIALLFTLPAFANHHEHGKGHHNGYGKGKGHGHHHGVGKNMKMISEDYGTLGKQIDDQAKNKESITLVESMIFHSEKAMKHKPKDPAKAEKFNTDMTTMMTQLTGMKTALQANNNAEARTHYDALKPWTSPDHAKQY